MEQHHARRDDPNLGSSLAGVARNCRTSTGSFQDCRLKMFLMTGAEIATILTKRDSLLVPRVQSHRGVSLAFLDTAGASTKYIHAAYSILHGAANVPYICRYLLGRLHLLCLRHLPTLATLLAYLPKVPRGAMSVSAARSFRAWRAWVLKAWALFKGPREDQRG